MVATLYQQIIALIYDQHNKNRRFVQKIFVSKNMNIHPKSRWFKSRQNWDKIYLNQI